MRCVLFACLFAAAFLGGCDGAENPLAPYEGARPLEIQRVTRSFSPDFQWVGGRVAAVGVNRGTEAALDSSLVWLSVADDNSIGGPVSIGEGLDADLVRQYGGTPTDSLASDETYTFWIAEKSALDAALDPAKLDAFTFTDTTVTLALLLNGRNRGSLGFDVQILRDERLDGETYRVNWTPADRAVRRVALVKGSALPSFTGLVWHIVQPDGTPDAILPPVALGETPPGAETAVEWAGTFEPATYTLWMVDDTWDGSFSSSAKGLAYYVIFSSNF